MQWRILLLMLALTGLAVRRGKLLAAVGRGEEAARLLRRACIALGSAVWMAMLTQEALLLASGQLTPATGLPLHLCSLMGVLTLPMLLGRSRTLRSAALFAGLPGALLALLFPAYAATPWPAAAAASFHVLHAGLVCAPLLAMGCGWRPSPGDAGRALLFLAAAGGIAMAANRLTGGNYLFLGGPVAGTPLTLLAGGGNAAYRLGLAACAGAALLAEAALTALLRRVGWARKLS